MLWQWLLFCQTERERRKWKPTQWTWLPALNHKTESQLPDGYIMLRTLHESAALSLTLLCETGAISVLLRLLCCHCVQSTQCVKSTPRESRYQFTLKLHSKSLTLSSLFHYLINQDTRLKFYKATEKWLQERRANKLQKVFMCKDHWCGLQDGKKNNIETHQNNCHLIHRWGCALCPLKVSIHCWLICPFAKIFLFLHRQAAVLQFENTWKQKKKIWPTRNKSFFKECPFGNSSPKWKIAWRHQRKAKVKNINYTLKSFITITLWLIILP